MSNEYDGYFDKAIPATWEEYNEHMLRTGQWMTWNDYVMFVDHGLEPEIDEELDYASSTHGC